MIEQNKIGNSYLEVISPDNSRVQVALTLTPFFIGRGDDGNHLALPDKRISRQCAAITREGQRFILEARAHRLGVFVDGELVTRQTLRNGAVISFGLADSFHLEFHDSSHGADASGITQIPAREFRAAAEPGPAPAPLDDAFASGLDKLSLLLEATSLLHSQLPLEAVLHAMLDRAITITNADRALLMEVDSSGALRPWLARRKGSNLPAEEFAPSQTAVDQALKQRSAVVTEDVNKSEGLFDAAQSIITQRLRTVAAMPLYAMPRASTDASMVRTRRGEFLGLLYLDSQRPAAFSKLDRQMLDAIAMGSASILDNARLVKRELERQRFEQELNIARDIQQALLPRGVRDYPHLEIRGVNTPCHAVGGDYYDVFPVDERRTAFLISDVAGKGLGAALLTTMMQGALTGMSLGTEPARMIQHINAFLCSHEAVDRYATLFYATVDLDGNLEYLNAGHLPPLLLRDGVAGELFTQGSFPVGLIAEADFAGDKAKLLPGDTLVLFSDGVTEAANTRDDLFGLERLQEVLSEQQELPLDALLARIVAAVEKFSDGASPSDDMTILLVRYRGAAQPSRDREGAVA